MQLRHATRTGLWLRRARVATLAVQRFARWVSEDGFAPPERVAPTGSLVLVRRVPIARAGAHPRLEAGKRINVKLAAAAFHGVVITPERPLSFWRTLGPATAARGFAWGMELRSGCAVPAIGGGLCVMSNALFAIAVELGWSVLERHGHSMALADPGALDATVAYPHVDLRIAPREGFAVLDVALRGDVLVVAVRARGAAPLRVELDRDQHDRGDARDTVVRRRVWSGPRLVEDTTIVDDRQRIAGELRTCLDCGETACGARVEVEKSTTVPTQGRGIVRGHERVG
jgi:vancomycin resistance protein VanW